MITAIELVISVAVTLFVLMVRFAVGTVKFVFFLLSMALGGRKPIGQGRPPDHQ
jgi:hypothetical protein